MVTVAHRDCQLRGTDEPVAGAGTRPVLGRHANSKRLGFQRRRLIVCWSVSPMSAARSLSDSRSVTRNASTPCS
jgi:hypothetical protein